MNKTKREVLEHIKERYEAGAFEEGTYRLLEKLIRNAKNDDEAILIAELGVGRRTGLNYTKKMEVFTSDIKYLKRNEKLSFKSENKSNLNHKLIIGDNYFALKNLLLTHRNKIDAIYIDPPYGSDSMGQFAKTNYQNNITRDNLLSMLYPRFMLAKQLLSENGVVFCSIDDRNMAYIKCLFDDIFGENQFVSDIIWQSKYTISNDKKNGMTTQTEHILCYAKKIENLYFNPAELKEEYVKKSYRYDDNDGRGLYRLVQLYKKKNPKSFTVVSPTGKEWTMPWNYTPETFAELETENKVYWGKDGNSCPQKKVYLADSEGMGNRNLWLGEDVGYQQDGGDMVESIFSDRNVFDYPKPVSLIKKILEISSNKNSIVLDFFAGSGTMGQAVLELNKEDGGARQFILCTNNEAEDGYIAENVTSKRLKRVMTGSCYDGNTDFEWIKKNEPYGDNLEVFDIAEVSANISDGGISPFNVIDETCYDKKFDNIQEKIDWICNNFQGLTKKLED